MIPKINLQYLIDKDGNKTAVIIPISEWSSIVNDLSGFIEYQNIKEKIKSAYSDVADMKGGKKAKTSLGDFLDEL